MTGRRFSIVVPLLVSAACMASACGRYSFTGATIPANLNTIAIPLAEDRSVNTLTGLDDQLTALLVTRFVQQTRLSFQSDEDEADAVLTATIERYLNQPASVSGDERATLNRVSISVSILYRDQTKNETLIERTFQSFEEYDPTDPERGLEGESDAARAVLDKIADDVFTAATSGW